MRPIPDTVIELPHRTIGRVIHHFTQIDSTSTQAAAFSDQPNQHGLAILADQQSAGRGQYGRSWSSLPNSGVLLSVLLFPPPELRRPVLLTALAAVAVGETILAVTGRQAKIKWPNDLLLHGKKVCGILIEAGTSHVVIGIGLNANTTAEEFTRLGLPDATSLAIHTGIRLNTVDLGVKILAALDEEYHRLLDGERTTLEACWKWRIGLSGKLVTVERSDGNSVSGRLLETGFDGIILVAENGERTRIAPEMIRHITPMDT
jgi:BirA family transcriptional regulator, biotin operon repressor / biotin---[acetyl-CoA-carboxylase] ligase